MMLGMSWSIVLRAVVVRVGLGAGVGWLFAYAIKFNTTDFFQFNGWFKVYEILGGAVVGLLWSWVALRVCSPLDFSPKVLEFQKEKLKQKA